MSLCPAQTQHWNPQSAAVLPVHMTQGLPRKFLHPRRGSHFHRLHGPVRCAGRLSMSPHCLVVMLRAGWRSAAARRSGSETESERTRLRGEVPRSAEARRIFTMTVARRGQEGRDQWRRAPSSTSSSSPAWRTAAAPSAITTETGTRSRRRGVVRPQP